MFRKIILSVAVLTLTLFLSTAISHRVPDPGLTGAVGTHTQNGGFTSNGWWNSHTLTDSRTASDGTTASDAAVYLTKQAKTNVLHRVTGYAYARASSSATVSGAVAKGKYDLLVTAKVYLTSRGTLKNDYQGEWSDNVSRNKTFFGNAIYSNVHIHGKAEIDNQAGMSLGKGTWN